MAGEGAQQYQKLIDGGFSQQDALKWREDRTAKLRGAGFDEAKIADYWGEGTPDTSTLDNLVKQNHAANWSPEMAKTADPNSIIDNLAAGFDMSSTSLAFRGAPKTIAPEQSGWAAKLAYGLGQFVGDLPAGIAGLFGGAAAGGAAGTTIGPEGTVAGGLVGGGAGAAALPEAIRTVAMDLYEKGEVTSFPDFMQRVAHVAYQSGKAAIVGGVAAPIGGAAGGKLLAAGASQSTAALADISAYTVAATGTQAVLDGHAPDAKDFVTSLVLAGTFHTGMQLYRRVNGRVTPTAEGEQVAKNMRDIYARTGVPPWEQAQRAQQDPVMRQAIFARDASNNPIQEPFKADGPQEPEPFKPKGTNAFNVETPELRGTETFDLVRHDQPGLDIYANRPHGLYTSSLSEGTKSPHEDVGPVAYQMTAAPTKVLSLQEGEKVTHARFGEFQSGFPSAGVAALRKLVSKENFDRLTKMSKGDLISELNSKFPGPDYSKYHDSYELLEAYGAQEARAQGYDFIHQKSEPINGTDFSEGVVLNPKILSENRFGQKPEEQLDLVRHLERSGDDAVSPAGAIGRYQIMPDTARQYGFDPARLKDPVYNERVAKAILADLSKRYRNKDGSVDMEAVLIAYNAGPGRANVFRANGRQFKSLPLETQRYLEHAERLGLNEPPAGGAGEPPKGGPPALPEGEPEPDPMSLNLDMLVEKSKDGIYNPVKPSIFDRAKDAIDRAKFEAVSELSPFERLDKRLGVGENEFGITDQFRQVYGSVGRAYHMLEFGQVDPITFEKVGKDALIPNYKSAIEKGSLDEIRALRQSLRTLELERDGRKTYQDPKEAAAIVAKMGRKYDKEIASFRRSNDAKVDYYRDSGMLSEQGAADMKAKNHDWFPQIVAKKSIGYAMRGNRFGPRQVLKSAEGHENQILDPVTQEIQSYYSMAAVSDKNRAVSGLVNALSKEEMKDLGIKQIETKKVELFDKDGNLIPEVVDQTGAFKLEDNQIAYYDKGVRKVFEVEDPQLAAAIRGMAPIKPDQTLSTLRWFAAIKRSGITDMPDFIARAMTKDAVGAAVLSKWGGVPFANTIRGLAHITKADPIFQEYVRNGGFGTALSDMDAKYVARSLHEIDAKTGMLGQVVNTVKHPLEAAQLVMQRADMATRIGIYLRAKDANLPTFKAGVEARKATLDFQEKAHGISANLYAGITPFFRPSILGLKQVYEAFTQRPFQTGAKAVIYIAAPVAALYVMNAMQDESLPEERKFKNLPRWQKDTMFILPEIYGVRLRLPMPPLLGTLVGGMVNRFLDYFYESDPRAFKDWGNTMLASLLPPFLPAALAPILEHAANYNSFSGKPLVPSSLEANSKYMQYTPATTEVAKGLARLIGPPGHDLVDLSPIVIDNYVREWSGPMGISALRLLATPFVTDEKPTDIANNPFVGSFFVRHPDTTAQPITDFYDALDQVKAKHKDFALAIKQQDAGLQSYALTQNKTFLNLYKMTKSLSNMNSAIQGITNDPTMKPDEKRQQIDTIAGLMIAVARQGTTVMDAME